MPLRLDHISYMYGRRTERPVMALDGVSLSVDRGELLLLLGPTGSGKSTLMRIAAGLMEPDSGVATLDGVPLTQASARGATGLVFQDPESQLFADSILDDVAFGPRNLGATAVDSRGHAERAMEAVGLPVSEFATRSPFALSGGEARRAAIAGVLAMQPSYLLADEPTAGLDAPGRKMIRDILLAERAHSGVVIVSHEADEFLGVADRVVLLAGASVAWTGPGLEAIRDPSVFALARLPIPDVLEVQHSAAQRGLVTDGYSLNPELAAMRLAAARRCE